MPNPLVAFLGLGFGGFLVFSALREMNTGVTQGRYGRYERLSNPNMFWVIVFGKMLTAIVVMIVGTVMLARSTS